MALPPAFVKEVLRLCEAFLSSKRLSIAQADSLVGKAGRVADVLPLTRPFVATLYAAMSAALAAAAAGAREAPPGMVACRRFRGVLVGCGESLTTKTNVPRSRTPTTFEHRPPPRTQLPQDVLRWMHRRGAEELFCSRGTGR